MPTKHFKWLFCIAAGSLLLSANNAQANSCQLPECTPPESLPQNACAAQYCEPQNCCDTNPWSIQLNGGYAFGRYIGLNESYAELGTLIATPTFGTIQPLIDLRGFRLDNGDWAASGGLGFRWWNPCASRVLGVNFFYDYRQADFTNLNRVGIGLESLGECLDFRLNVYIPVDGDIKRSSWHHYDHFLGGYQAQCREKAFNFRGVDAEIGWHMWRSCDFSLYGAAGPYYYERKKDNGIFGGEAFLGLSWRSYISLELQGSYDREFEARGQAKIWFNIPLTDLFCCRPDDPCRDLITQSFRRNYIPFTQKCCDWKWNW